MPRTRPHRVSYPNLVADVNIVTSGAPTNYHVSQGSGILWSVWPAAAPCEFDQVSSVIIPADPHPEHLVITRLLALATESLQDLDDAMRAIEIIAGGKPQTPFMRFGDVVRIEMLDANGNSIFGAIEQRIERHDS